MTVKSAPKPPNRNWKAEQGLHLGPAEETVFEVVVAIGVGGNFELEAHTAAQPADAACSTVCNLDNPVADHAKQVEDKANTGHCCNHPKDSRISECLCSPH